MTAFGGVRIPGRTAQSSSSTARSGLVISTFALRSTCRFRPSGFAAERSLITKNWADPVAGLAAHYVINDKWFINFLTDLGGLDNSATGQVLGSVGYNWTPSISTTLGYRALYTYERDISGPLRDFRYQAWMYGPLAGVQI